MPKHEQKHFTFQSTSQRGVATARAVPKSMMRFRRTSTSLLYYINLTDFTTAELDETVSYQDIYYALCPCSACLCPCSACLCQCSACSYAIVWSVAHGLFFVIVGSLHVVSSPGGSHRQKPRKDKTNNEIVQSSTQTSESSARSGRKEIYSTTSNTNAPMEL